MGCRCSERRAVIAQAIQKPSTLLTAANFVVKTSAQDIVRVPSAIANRLQRRGNSGK